LNRVQVDVVADTGPLNYQFNATRDDRTAMAPDGAYRRLIDHAHVGGDDLPAPIETNPCLYLAADLPDALAR
jgi:hypothetical protein